MTDVAVAAEDRDQRRSLALLKAVGLDRVAPEQRELALNIARRYELDLMLKHLVLIDGRPYITRDGLLHVAHRDGSLDGIVTSEPVLGDDGYWRSTCSVYRKDMTHPFSYTGRYPKNGSNAKFAPEMAVKVGEVMALRRAFDVAAPVAEERWDRDVPEPDPKPRQSLAEVAASKRAEVEAVPEPEPDVMCGDPSPYGDGDPCGLPAGHVGMHKDVAPDGTVVATWPAKP
jgi:hypothetical protein